MTRDDFIEHEQAEARQKIQEYREESLQAQLQKCAKLLSNGDTRDLRRVALILSESEQGVVSRLEDLATKPLDEYVPEDTSDDGWFWDSFDAFRSDTSKYVSAIDGSGSQREVQARRVVTQALSTAARLSECFGVVKGKYTKTATGIGFGGQELGEVYKDPKMPFGDPVELIVERGTIKSLYAGGTNTGKSSSAEGQFENYYRRNFINGEPATKCIDPVDTSVAENIFYDVPQDDGALRKAREDMDLSVDFTEMAGPDPQQEIFVPLSPVLEDPDTKLPYDTEDGEWCVRPFIIPASDISPELFISLVTARVTSSIENVLRQVYEAVDRERSQWSLQHLAEEIADRDDISDRQQRESIMVIQALQDTGFVRQSNPEYELDWDAILRDTDTITVFNQLYCRHDWERKFIFAWILEQMLEQRRKPVQYPQMAMMIRELWEYAPKENRDSDSDLSSSIQERIVSLLATFMRKNRDFRAHIVSDTQNPGDLNVEIREEFNRFCLFESIVSMAEKFCKWTGNQKYKAFASNITVDVGECGIVGAAGPPMEHPYVEYVAPVAMAPASHHHHDKDDGIGFAHRPSIVENEEVRRPGRTSGLEWPISLPKSSQIDPEELLEEDDEEDEDDGTPDVEPKVLHRNEARNRRKNGESYRDIRRNIPNNVNTGNPYSVSTIKDWVDDIEPTEGGGSSGDASGMADD